MQFAHPRLLITSSLPLRFSSVSSVSPPFLLPSPPFPLPFSSLPLRFSVLLRFFRRFLRFSAGSSVFPFPRRFRRFSAGSLFFSGSPPFPRYRRLGAPPEGAVGAVTEGETAEAWEEGDAGARAEGDAGACVELYRILGFSGYSCGANPSNGRIFSRAVPHFAQNMVQLDRGCTDMICFIYICRRLHSISKEMWGKNVM